MAVEQVELQAADQVAQAAEDSAVAAQAAVVAGAPDCSLRPPFEAVECSAESMPSARAEQLSPKEPGRAAANSIPSC